MAVRFAAEWVSHSFPQIFTRSIELRTPQTTTPVSPDLQHHLLENLSLSNQHPSLMLYLLQPAVTHLSEVFGYGHHPIILPSSLLSVFPSPPLPLPRRCPLQGHHWSPRSHLHQSMSLLTALQHQPVFAPPLNPCLLLVSVTPDDVRPESLPDKHIL